jgi:hypothetical protein
LAKKFWQKNFGKKILAKKFWQKNFGKKILAKKFWQKNFGKKNLAKECVGLNFGRCSHGLIWSPWLKRIQGGDKKVRSPFDDGGKQRFRFRADVFSF